MWKITFNFSLKLILSSLLIIGYESSVFCSLYCYFSLFSGSFIPNIIIVNSTPTALSINIVILHLNYYLYIYLPNTLVDNESERTQPSSNIKSTLVYAICSAKGWSLSKVWIYKTEANWCLCLHRNCVKYAYNEDFIKRVNEIVCCSDKVPQYCTKEQQPFSW